MPCWPWSPSRRAKTTRTQELQTIDEFKSKNVYLKSCLERFGRTEPFAILGGSPQKGFKPCDA